MKSSESSPKKISVLYPEITSITLFVAFEEADAEADPNYQQIIFTRDSEAAFHLGCTRDDCVDGGFDYTPFIDELVQSGAARAHGKIACQGKLGGDAGGQCCSLQSEYRIIIR